MRVRVLQHYIDAGTPRSPSNCAVARAIREQVPGAAMVTVNSTFINIDGVISNTPAVAGNAVRRIDEHEAVEPFEFELEVRELVLA